MLRLEQPRRRLAQHSVGGRVPYLQQRLQDEEELHVRPVAVLLLRPRQRLEARLELGDVVKIEGFELTFLLDKQPISSEIRTDEPAAVASVAAEWGHGMTMLAEDLPIGVAIAPGDWLLLNMVENYLGALEGLEVLDVFEKKWFEDGSWLIQLP